MDAGQPPVHLIVDDSGVQSAPRRLDQLLRAMSFVQHPAFGWGIMIGNAPLSHRFLIDLIGRLSPVSYHRLDTLSEAMAFLHAQDPSLEVDDVV